MKNEADDPRRRILIQMLAAGMFGGVSTAAPTFSRRSSAARRPSCRRASRSIASPARSRSTAPRALSSRRSGPGSMIQTGKNSEIVYAVGQSAFIARPQTQVVIETPETGFDRVGLRLLTGKLLSVFPSGRPMQLTTRRGDHRHPRHGRLHGVRSGADLLLHLLRAWPTSPRTTTRRARRPSRRDQHDRPLYILGGEPAGQNIRVAPFINHTDQELHADRDAGRTHAAVRVPEDRLHRAAAQLLTRRRPRYCGAPLRIQLRNRS